MGKSANTIVARALNRASLAGRTAAFRATANDAGIPIKAITKHLKITEATKENLTATASVTGERIPLINFHARGPEPSKGRGRGVSYKLTGGRGKAPHAFIATMKSKHKGVFIRKGGSGRSPKGWSKNLKIIEAQGPSVQNVLEKHMPEFDKRASEAVEKNLRSQIDWLKK